MPPECDGELLLECQLIDGEGFVIARQCRHWDNDGGEFVADQCSPSDAGAACPNSSTVYAE
jgi:hypothetical protein